MKSLVLNGSEGTDGCFTAAFSQTQHASFSVRCGGRTEVGDGNGTQKNIPACAHERQNNRTATSLRLPFQASANVMEPSDAVNEGMTIQTEGRRLALGPSLRPHIFGWLVGWLVRELS